MSSDDKKSQKPRQGSQAGGKHHETPTSVKTRSSTSAASSPLPGVSDMQRMFSILTNLENKVETMNTNLASIETKIDETKTDIAELKTKVDTAIDQSNNALKKVVELEEKIEVQNEKIANLERRVSDSSIKFERLNEKYLRLETDNLKDNLLFHGVIYNDNEECTVKMKKIFRDELTIDPGVIDNMTFECIRLPGKIRPTPILCRFVKSADRELVWSKRKKLQNSTIRMSENFPEDIRRRRATLAPYAPFT